MYPSPDLPDTVNVSIKLAVALPRRDGKTGPAVDDARSSMLAKTRPPYVAVAKTSPERVFVNPPAVATPLKEHAALEVPTVGLEPVAPHEKMLPPALPRAEPPVARSAEHIAAPPKKIARAASEEFV